jgi:hypothetical protein
MLINFYSEQRRAICFKRRRFRLTVMFIFYDKYCMTGTVIVKIVYFTKIKHVMSFNVQLACACSQIQDNTNPMISICLRSDEEATNILTSIAQVFLV